MLDLVGSDKFRTVAQQARRAIATGLSLERSEQSPTLFQFQDSQNLRSRRLLAHLELTAETMPLNLYTNDVLR